MKRAAAAFVFLALASCQTAPAAEPAVVIANASVIDVRTGETAARDLLVRGERIAAAAPRGALEIPRGARVIDAEGLFALPGLWDAHVHLTGDADFEARAPVMLIANGVTSVRDMAGSLDAVLALRARANSGAVISPHIWAAGQLIEGHPPVRPEHAFVATTAQEAERAVDILAASGVDFVKAYEMLAPDVAAAIAARAHHHGLKLVGHVPMRMTTMQAMEAGYDGFEHLRGFEFDCAENADELLAARVALMDEHADEPGRALRRRVHASVRPEAFANQDPERCAALIEAFRARGAWHAPTLSFVAFRSLRYYESPAWSEPYQYLAAPMAAEWRERLAEFTDPGQYAEWEAHGDWARRMVGALHRAGVNLLAGTDSSRNYIFAPGFALHDELQSFVDSGVPALATLQAATINPARFFDLEHELGALEAGYIADIVLLRANPLDDISATRQIETVIARGRVFDRAALDAMLAELEASAE